MVTQGEQCFNSKNLALKGVHVYYVEGFHTRADDFHI